MIRGTTLFPAAAGTLMRNVHPASSLTWDPASREGSGSDMQLQREIRKSQEPEDVFSQRHLLSEGQ